MPSNPSSADASSELPLTVLMLGGGVQQVEAVRQVQSFGYRVIVSDRNPDAPAFELADEAWVVDGSDVLELTRRAVDAKRRGLRAVFTLTELVESVAAVSIGAELPGTSLEAARACQDKAASANLFERAGVPIPKTFATTDLGQAQAAFHELGGRAFVKPSRAFGGRGSGRATHAEQLEQVFANARKESPHVLVQELLTGSVHDTNGIFDSKGHFHRAGLADRSFHPEHPIELGASAPSNLSPEQSDQAFKWTELAARAVGINFGPVKADFILADNQLRLLELAPRTHGPKGTLWLLPSAHEFSPLRASLEMLVGRPPTQQWVDTAAKHCTYRGWLAPAGKLLALHGLKAARAVPGVEHILQLRKVGESIRPARDSSAVVLYVFASGETQRDVDRSLDTALGELRADMK